MEINIKTQKTVCVCPKMEHAHTHTPNAHVYWQNHHYTVDLSRVSTGAVELHLAVTVGEAKGLALVFQDIHLRDNVEMKIGQSKVQPPSNIIGISIHPSMHPSIQLSIHPSIYPSVCPCTYLINAHILCIGIEIDKEIYIYIHNIIYIYTCAVVVAIYHLFPRNVSSMKGELFIWTF